MTLLDSLRTIFLPHTEVSTKFEHLPEELIDKVIYFLQSPSSLAAAALVSRKLNRIVTPHLYSSVYLTVGKSEKTVQIIVETPNLAGNGAPGLHEGKFDVPTTDNCNASAFIKTLNQRPELRRYVKNLYLFRNDTGYDFRRALGYYDEGTVLAGPPDETLVRIDAATMNHEPPNPITSSMDPTSRVMFRLFRVLPQVRHIDCSGYRTDVPWNVMLGLMGFSATIQTPEHDFKQLRMLRMNCQDIPFVRLWPVFTLPNLVNLGLVNVLLDSVADSDPELDNWQTLVRSTSITALMINNAYGFSRHSAPDLTLLRIISRACNRLDALRISMDHPGMTQDIISTFEDHLPALGSLVLFEIIPARAAVGIAMSQLRLEEEDDPTTACLFQQSNNLRCLAIDAAILVSVFPPGELAPGVSIEMTLPRSLELLRLRVSNELDFQDAFLQRLAALSQDIATQFPRLQLLEIEYEVGGLVTVERGAKVLVPSVLKKLRRNGVKVVEFLAREVPGH